MRQRISTWRMSLIVLFACAIFISTLHMFLDPFGWTSTLGDLLAETVQIKAATQERRVHYAIASLALNEEQVPFATLLMVQIQRVMPDLSGIDCVILYRPQTSVSESRGADGISASGARQLEHAGWKLLPLAESRWQPGWAEEGCPKRHGWTQAVVLTWIRKMEVFSLVAYERIIWLDQDVLVRESLKPLFSLPAGLAVAADSKFQRAPDKTCPEPPRPCPQGIGDTFGNGGVMVLQPSSERMQLLFRDVQARRQCPQKYGQIILAEAFWPRGEYLYFHPRWNVRDGSRHLANSSAIFHFVGRCPKPNAYWALASQGRTTALHECKWAEALYTEWHTVCRRQPPEHWHMLCPLLPPVEVFHGMGKSMITKASSWYHQNCNPFVPKEERYVLSHGTSQNGSTINVTNHGSWDFPTCKGTHQLDLGLAKRLAQLMAGGHVYEWGAGCGCYSAAILAQGTVESFTALDGTRNIWNLTDGIVQTADFTNELGSLISQHDWSLSMEVGEHIPSQFEDQFLQNLAAGVRSGVILSWAIPGQGGTGHVNERSNEDVARKMETLGFHLDRKATKNIRVASHRKYLKKTLMVFRK